MALEDVIAQIQSQRDSQETAEAAIGGAQAEVAQRAQLASESVTGRSTANGDSQGASGASPQGQGAMQTFRKAFQGSQGIVANVADYLISENPALGGEVQIDREGVRFRPAEEVYGEDFTSEWLDPQDRRDMIQQQRAAEVQEYWGDTGDYAVANVLGQIAGAAADPTSLIPVGQGIRAAVGMGAALGGVEAATAGLAAEGAIDPVDVAVGSALGAATAGVIEGAVVQPIKSIVEKYAAMGRPVDANSVIADLDSQGVDRSGLDIEALKEQLNADFGLNETTPELTRVMKYLKEDDPSAIEFEYKMAKADEFLSGETEFSDQLQRSQFEFGKEPKKVRKERINVIESETKALQNYKGQKPAIGMKPVEKIERSEFLDGALAEALSEKELTFDVLKQAAPTNSPLYTKIKQESLMTPDYQSRNPYQIPGEEGGDTFGIIASKNVPWTSDTGVKIDAPIGRITQMGDPTFSPRDAQNWAERMISGGQAALGSGNRLKNMQTPWGNKAHELLTRAFDDTQSRIGDFVSGYRVLRSKLGVKQGSPEELEAIQYMRRTIKDASPKAKAIAEKVTSSLNSALKEARDLGIVSPKDFDKLMAKGAKKGYFPRAYNYDYLMTGKGHQEFLNRMSSAVLQTDANGTALEKATAIAEAILPKDEVPIFVKQLKDSQGNEKFIRIPSNLSEMLWTKYGQKSSAFRSSHLEAPRVLPEEWENIMEPFLINDMEAVMSSYAQDVFTRLEYARQFGAKDEVARKIEFELAKEDPRKALDFMHTLWTAVGDPNSDTVKSFIDKPQKVKRLVAGAKAFQTMKLGLAQIANVTQTPVNGWYHLMAQDGLNVPKATSIYTRALLKGVRDSFGDVEAQHTVDKFGATTQTMLLDAMGGINESMHTVTGRNLGNPLLEFFNNPTVMLRSVGYFGVENFNRRMAHYLGTSLAEEAIERKARFLAQGNRIHPDKIKQVDRTLRELGLDPDVDPKTYSVRDKQLAGQRASNTINFTSDPQTSPFIMQSFWGKFATQFKSFIVKQTNFLASNVIKPAMRGNFKPLILGMGAVGTPLGMGVDSARRWVMGDDREFTMTERVIRAHTMIGSLGLFSDLASRLSFSKEGLANWIAGPSVSDLGRAGYAGIKTVTDLYEGKDNPYKTLKKEVVKTFVFPGRQAVVDNLGDEKNEFDFGFEEFELEE